MKPQRPAQGISIDQEWNDAVVYNIECDCGSDDHSIKMWIEVNRDADIPDVEVSFYVETHTENTWASWPNRLRAIRDIVFKGTHKQEHHMLLNRQSAVNLAAAITETVKRMEKPAK